MALYSQVMDTARSVIRCQQFSQKIDLACATSAIQLTSALTVASFKSSDNTAMDTHQETLWSDACTSGLGAVFKNQAVHVAMRSIRPGQMCAAELLAGYVGARTFSAQLPQKYTWGVDNTAAARSMLRGHSGSHAADTVILHWILSAPLPSTVKIVPTLCQVADRPSRGEQLMESVCDHFHPFFSRRFVV